MILDGPHGEAGDGEDDEKDDDDDCDGDVALDHFVMRGTRSGRRVEESREITMPSSENWKTG